MKKQTTFFLFLVTIAAVYAQSDVEPVYTAPAPALQAGKSGFIKTIRHREKNNLHDIRLEIKDPAELVNLKEIYIYVDNDINGKNEKCVSYIVDSKAGWIFNLDEKEDWNSYTANKNTGVKISKFIDISIDEQILAIKNMRNIFMVQISLKFAGNSDSKEYFTNAGFITDSGLVYPIDGKIDKTKLPQPVFSRKIKMDSNRIEPVNGYLLESDGLVTAALELSRAARDNIEFLDIRFMEDGSNDYVYYIIINFFTGQYFFHEKATDKWTLFFLPYKAGAAFEWIMPGNAGKNLKDKEIYISYKVADEESYCRRILFSSRMAAFKPTGKESSFKTSELVYKNPGLSVRANKLDMERVYLKEEKGWIHLGIKNNSGDFSKLSEVGIYNDSNSNDLPESGYRFIFKDDYIQVTAFNDSWNWDNSSQLFYSLYSVDDIIELVFKGVSFSGNYKIQLHYDLPKDNFFQLRKSNVKPDGKTMDGRLNDWQEEERKSYKTVTQFASGRNDFPQRGFISLNNEYAVFGIENCIKDYKNLTNFRVYFDTDFDGAWNHVVDFALWNAEGHIYFLNNINDWSNNAVHDITSGLTTGDAVEGYIPLRYLKFDPIKAFILFSLVYTDPSSGQVTSGELYGRTYKDDFALLLDGKNMGEWKENDILVKDRKWDNNKEGDINIKSVYHKKSGINSLFALDFYNEINCFVKRIFLNIDTDGDGKINNHFSLDLAGGACYSYKPDDRDDYKEYTLLSKSICSLEKDFLEFNLPAAAFTGIDKAVSEITFGLEYSYGDLVKYDYAMAGIIPAERKADFDKLRNLKPVSIIDHGENSKKVDIIILPDGYTEKEKDKFINTANQMVKEFLENKTFALFKDDFNFYYMFIASKESGSYDVLKGGKIPDTIYKAGVWEEGFYTSRGRLEILYSMNNAPDYDVIWVVSNNDSTGAGTGSNVAGICGISISGSAGIKTPIHETGHALFGFTDEYENEFYAKTGSLPPVKENYKNSINVTVLDEIDFTNEASFKKSLKWGWIYDYPILKNIAGLYEGAMYVPKDRYRCEKTCVMRDGESAGGSRFCIVCMDSIAEKMADIKGVIYSRAALLDNPDIFTEYDMMRIKYDGETRNLSIIKTTGTVNAANKPENSIDQDIYSYWEGENPSNIVYDLGKTMNIGGLFLSLFQDESSKYYYQFQVQVSNDNKLYKAVYTEDGENPFNIAGLFIDINQNARYLKLICKDAKPYNRFYIRDLILFSNGVKNDLLLGYKELKLGN